MSEQFAYEEGSECKECEDGTMKFWRENPCTCHLTPPCSACVNSVLMCNNCDYEPTEEEIIS